MNCLRDLEVAGVTENSRKAALGIATALALAVVVACGVDGAGQ